MVDHLVDNEQHFLLNINNDRKMYLNIFFIDLAISILVFLDKWHTDYNTLLLEYLHKFHLHLNHIFHVMLFVHAYEEASRDNNRIESNKHNT